ncbi:MAG: Transglutaminase-like superfamily protein [Methanosaeta sp. PtaB.Bin018]|nr:MAG: Transglutaminase-like superfamily protein [Methanosaeta sp. PtaB.Bin018]OPY47023.1 MAG: Transglutaminase-like superfamily protein [Methanosaeta sp. PtaU1.Bin016]
MGAGYNWAGDTIVRDTVMWDKRAVLGHSSVYIPTDIRQWLSSTESEVIQRTLQEIGLPAAREAGSFDLRAWRIWDYVVRSVEYVTDKRASGLEDFWLFPEETLMLHKGDCEDTSFLLATLMLASGISEHCVRVVLGKISSPEGAFGHAWVVYQNETGTWCLLESTLDAVPSQLVPADPFTQPSNQYQYQPQFCLNASHLWSMTQVKVQMADWVKLRTGTKKAKLGCH